MDREKDRGKGKGKDKDKEEEEAREPAGVRDKVAPVEEAKVLGAAADKGVWRRVLAVYASVRNAGIPNPMSAACPAYRPYARNVARPCVEVKP